ncbi:ATPase [Paracoccus sp. Z118]|uniref:ATP12 family chaperone protein n=1 Tax=Paracoccus sp. Z118 TaxID=2851017 RepID=UPI001C2C81B4|nr:ATP12 family protein [Paracoccus sp. Z118]MBV0891287.1 ATPase [Paracoccus sp. Z118]
MSEWKPKRFWTRTGLERTPEGWRVALDGKPVNTPGKLPLILPTEGLAQAVAAEWDTVGELIDPGAMPLTRAANSAIEKVAPQFPAVAALLAEYGGTDLLSYRDDRQEALALEQAAEWDPLLDWAAEELGARLIVTRGVMPVVQDEAALRTLAAHVAALDPWGLTALHDLVTLPGSLILGLATVRGRIDADEAHRLARLDEDFQSRLWGHDDEADAAADARRAAMRVAERLWRLSRAG